MIITSQLKQHKALAACVSLCALCMVFSFVCMRNAKVFIETETALNDLRYQEQSAEIERLSTALDETLSIVADQQEQIELLLFDILDIPLSPELQRFTYYSSLIWNVPPEDIFAAMEHESRFLNVGTVIDTNGLVSTGRMQINEPHHNRLMQEYGIDISTEKGEILAGIAILSELNQKYSGEKIFVAYECGESGAVGIDSTEFSRWVLERSEYWKEQL